MQTVDTLEGSFCSAAAFFQTGKLGGKLCGLLLDAFAVAAHLCQLILLCFKRDFRGLVLSFEFFGFGTLLLDGGVLQFAYILVARGLHGPFLHAAIDALNFSLHLFECSALVGSVALGLAALLAASLKLRGHFFNAAGKGSGLCF